MDKSNIKILVVDDDPQLLKLLSDTLSTIGYSVLNANKASDAIDLLATSKTDLLISDIKMPGMDGFELLELVRNLYPKIPVVFITGTAKPESVVNVKPEGYLSKPFRISNLEEVILRTLAGEKDSTFSAISSVLIVDDDLIFREMLVDAFISSGYSPVAVSSAEEALKILENSNFDAVISDIKMPGIDGIDFTKKVKERFPDLPVILVSAYQIIEDYNSDAQQRVADGYLRKPFGIELIIEILEKVILKPAKLGSQP